MASVPRRDVRNSQVVTEIEDRLGRRARPFSLDLILLPVADEHVRLVGAAPGLLRALVTPIA
ncbi:hypothetical protein [Actinoallomurus iriomotensis]|uniref:hypothetical protein n=1 Tax=Actinoallomurus iriomotensis TaxID=478107 RepID=UPI002557795B|nr:hypothetical protein [Actinoallomurus iriomotensis]